MTASTPDTRPLRIAVIAGDGIGKEVMPEGLRVLQAVNRRFDLGLDIHPF
jgi:tartrate dehydrogenase/decarboxylase/D-malate dehydrogenase